MQSRRLVLLTIYRNAIGWQLRRAAKADERTISQIVRFAIKAWLTRTPVAIALVLGLSGCSSRYDTRPTYLRADHGPTRMCLSAEEGNCWPTPCADPCNFLTLLVYNQPDDQCGTPRLIPLG
jgi:hypothetical protein